MPWPCFADQSLFTAHPNRPCNALTGTRVLVSPSGTDRRKEGQTEEVPDDGQPAYNPNCHLRSGNDRAKDAENPDHGSTVVFDNDFSALYLDLPVDKAALESFARQGGSLYYYPLL